MSGAYTVRGGDQLRRTMHQAAVELADLSEAHRRIANRLMDAARPRTPKRSGRLVGSLQPVVTAAGVELSSSLVYAGPIHWGWPARNIRANPFLTDAVDRNTDTILGFYVDELQAAIDGVKGA